MQSGASGASVWTSLRHAVVSIWGESKLKEKSQRLESIRSELQFHVIVSIKARIDVQGLGDVSQMEQFDEGTRRLIDATMKDAETTRIELDSRIEGVNQKLKDARQQLDRQHREAMSLAVHHHTEQMNAIRTFSGQLRMVGESIDVSMVTQQILNSLWFSRMSDRLDDIKPAHQQTFEWIFSSHKNEGLTTCTFMDWMAGDNGIYWVSGRAGSGKSTLMKFLAQDDRTGPAFETWAGGRDLIIARHWFWSQAQDPLQKSLQGFLRALVHDIIQQNHDYAPLLFPDQFVAGKDWADFPTSHELTRAFSRLSSMDNPPACIALMIDGLDEYEASEEEHFELARVLKEVGRSNNFKVVVSSRPETPFETIFGDCDRLRLHELTRNDRRAYVADLLNGHWRINFLVDQVKDGAEVKERLIDCAVDKSGGVFLWMRLVAAALIEELNTCDTLDDLEIILDKFPRGLEELYRHMFQRIPEQRRIKGVQLIQLVRCSVAVSEMKAPWNSQRKSPPPMSAHALSAAHAECTAIIKRDRKPLQLAESNDAIRKVDHLLRSHCAGLLELKYDGKVTATVTDAAQDNEDPEVVFVHKSVVEFLDLPETQSQLLSIGSGVNGFDAYLSLATCLLFKLKISDPPRHTYSEWRAYDHIHHHWPEIWYLVERIMRSAAFAETVDLTMIGSILDDLDRSLTAIFAEVEEDLRNSNLNGSEQTTTTRGRAEFPLH